MKLEVLEKDCYYHIYNRGVNGTNIFENEANKLYFLKQLTKYLSDKISILAYCLMNNHFHLVIQLNSEEKEVIQSFSNLFILMLKRLTSKLTELEVYLRNILKE
jgi:putative transposase